MHYHLLTTSLNHLENSSENSELASKSVMKISNTGSCHLLQIHHKESVDYKRHVLISEITPDIRYRPKLKLKRKFKWVKIAKCISNCFQHAATSILYMNMHSSWRSHSNFHQHHRYTKHDLKVRATLAKVRLAKGRFAQVPCSGTSSPDWLSWTVWYKWHLWTSHVHYIHSHTHTLTHTYYTPALAVSGTSWAPWCVHFPPLSSAG